MTNPVVTRPRIQRAIAPPRLHASLKGRDQKRAKPVSSAQPGDTAVAGLWPMLAFVFAGLYVAQAAEFTQQAWPLAVLLTLPVAALIYGWVVQPRPQPVTVRREAKTMVDRRPILLQPVLILPPGRPARIVSRVPRKLGIVFYPPPHRPAKIRHPRPTLSNGSRSP